MIARSFFTTLIILATIPSVRAATIRVTGLRSFSQEDVIDENAGRFTFITKRPASTSRADDAAFLVEQYLQTRGLPKARVTWSLPGADVILLNVNEGPPRYVGTVTVQGESPVDREKVEDQFFAPSRKKGHTVKDRIPYLPKEIRNGGIQATSYLNSLGYWDAAVESRVGTADAAGDIPVGIFLRPGALHKLTQPRINSPLPLDEDTVTKINALAGEDATAENINTLRQTVLLDYQRRGYQKSTVDLVKTDSRTLTTIALTVDPGPRYRLGKVKLDGLQKTNPERVSGRFDELLGLPYDSKKVRTQVQSLIATGAFERFQVEENPIDGQEIDLTLRIREAKARGVEFSAGAGSFEGFILGARYFDRNWLGELYNLSVGTEISGIGLLGEVSVTDPFFLNTDLRFTPRIFFVTRNFEGYSKIEGGLGAELAWKVNDYYRVIFGAETLFATVRSEGLPVEALGQTDYLVTRLKAIQRYDRRDDKTLPSDGYYLQWDNTLGIALGDDSVTYFETLAQASYYKTFAEKNALNLGLRAGAIIPTGDQNRLPIDLRQFIGGSSTVRSFPERELGPSENGFPTGGNAYWIANAEYLREVKGPVKAVVFLDAGALSQNYEDLFSAEVKVALGLGVRIDLPIGPVRLEYGRALNPADGDPGGTFHFAIGTTF